MSVISKFALGQDVLISPFSIHSFGGTDIGGPASAVYPLANLALYFPFVLAEPVLVKKVAWMNGTAVSGNVDVGVYDEVGTRLFSTGSTAQAGTSAKQEVDITDIYLTPGLYYLAIACDNTTATFLRSTQIQEVARILGCMEQTSAFALPATATFAQMARAGYIPCFLLAAGTVI